MSEPVAMAQRGAVAEVVLSRPEKLNAIDAAVCDRLLALMDELEATGEVRAVVLAGAGERAFSSGADLKAMGALSGAALRRFIEHTWRVFDRVARSPLATVAALHGYVLGGGAELALACDLRVMERTAEFGFPEMSHGGLPGSGAMQRLPALIGPSRAFELAALGRRVGGEEAAAMGLVNRVVDHGGARAAAFEWAEILAARSPEALRYAKAALRIGPDPSVAAAFHGLVSSVRQADPDYRASTARFRADRSR